MTSNGKRIVAVFAAAALGIIAWDSVYVIQETEQGVLTHFGKIAPPVRQPGLHLKWPRPVSRVYKVDRRVHTLSGLPHELITEDQKSVLYDGYLLWRVEDPVLFVEAIRTGGNAAARLRDLYLSSSGVIISNKAREAFIGLGPGPRRTRRGVTGHPCPNRAHREGQLRHRGAQGGNRRVHPAPGEPAERDSADDLRARPHRHPLSKRRGGDGHPHRGARDQRAREARGRCPCRGDDAPRRGGGRGGGAARERRTARTRSSTSSSARSTATTSSSTGTRPSCFPRTTSCSSISTAARSPTSPGWTDERNATEHSRHPRRIRLLREAPSADSRERRRGRRPLRARQRLLHRQEGAARGAHPLRKGGRRQRRPRAGITPSRSSIGRTFARSSESSGTGSRAGRAAPSTSRSFPGTRTCSRSTSSSSTGSTT